MHFRSNGCHRLYCSESSLGNHAILVEEVTQRMTTGVDDLLERVRSHRTLPVASERRQIREAAGVSLRDVATALGVSHTAVASWEAGSTPREQRTAYARLLDELRKLGEVS